jgi:hypothetical protein
MNTEEHVPEIGHPETIPLQGGGTLTVTRRHYIPPIEEPEIVFPFEPITILEEGVVIPGFMSAANVQEALEQEEWIRVLSTFE